MIEEKDILNCIDDYIIVTDEQGKVIFCNYEEAKALYQFHNQPFIKYQDKYYLTTKKVITKEKQVFHYHSFHDITNLYQQNQLLRKQVVTDPLTQVLNRYGINDAIEEYRTLLDSSCVIYADIDHFKRINDNYSHDAGDFVLTEVAKILKDSVRKEDLVGRMGGEEFLVILNSTNIEKAGPKIEQLKDTIEKHDFIWNNQLIKLTMSFGISEFIPGNDFNEAVIAADEALLYSKEHGRNKITYAPTQIKENESTKKRK
ncbi:MAG: GGDEF domain-containing protein [Bacilli bacterium]|nr:GGDEF domain-containing protein [Bacilli bacterium]MDD4808753.1 GGDEF domain-containing protein [Bacilli bacterium]